MLLGKSRVPLKLQLQVGGPNIKPHPDGAKIRSAEPTRFRLDYGATINLGVDSFMMSRQQIDDMQSAILVGLAEQDAILSSGTEIMLSNAIRRVEAGAQTVIKSIQSVRRLTTPDIQMLIDMKQHSDHYVPVKSPFFKQFKALADKVLDLSFCALAFHRGAGPHGHNFGETPILDTVVSFREQTKAVTRGMDQFCYACPNAAYTSPHVNFSVTPNAANYEETRFPTRFNRLTERVERIPKPDFLSTYCFYVNELFNVYRQYLRLIGHSARVEPLSEPVRTKGDFDFSDDDDPGKPAKRTDESVSFGSLASVPFAQEAEQKDAEFKRRAAEAEALRQRQAKLSEEQGSSSSSSPPGPGEIQAISTPTDLTEKLKNMIQLVGPNEFITPESNYAYLVKLFANRSPEQRQEILDQVPISARVRDGQSGKVLGKDPVPTTLGYLVANSPKTRKALDGDLDEFLNKMLSKFSNRDFVSSTALAKLAKKSSDD